MKEQILKLREEGYSYRAIQAQLKCSKGLVAYYCGEGQKEKTKIRTRQRRRDHPVVNKFEFKAYSFNNKIKQFRDNENRMAASLTPNEAREVFEEQQGKCYLTGDTLDFTNGREVHFDHKTPISKGGSSTRENLGICTREANLAKSAMTIEEFLSFCQRILEFNGYTVTK